MMDNFFEWQKKNENKLSLWLNHLIVVYAFLLPLDHPRAGAFILWIVFGIALLRGNYQCHFSNVLKHPIVLAFLSFYMLHLVWNLYIYPAPLLVYTFKDNFEYALFLPLFLGIIDTRFSLRVFSAFLISMMLSELISYGMHFGFLPNELVFYGIHLPWHPSLRNIMIYSQGAFYTEDPAPFLKHSVYTGALAFSVAVMAYRLLNDNIHILYKIIMTFFILSMTYNISIVGGRAGYFIYIVLLLIVVIMTYKKKALLPITGLLFFLSIIGISAYTISPLFKQRINLTFQNVEALHDKSSSIETSREGRLAMWYYSSKIIKENLWTGVPEASFVKPVYQSIPISQRPMFEQWYFMPHNFYVSTLLQFGLFGFVLLINFFYQPLRYKHDNLEFNVIRILAVVMVAMSYITTDPIEYFFIPFLMLMVAITSGSRQYLMQIPEDNWKMILTYIMMGTIAFTVAILQ